MTLRGLHKAERLLDQARGAGLVVSIDTAGPSAVLGLVRNGVVLAGTAEKPGRSHAASLPETLSGLLERAAIKLTDLNGVAVGIGPGSFTGVRVALSYAKGLAFATRCSLAGVSSLESLAVCAASHPAARTGVLICAIVSAGRGQCYSAVYRVAEDAMEQVAEPGLSDAAQLSASLAGEVILAADDAQAFDGRLREPSAERNWVVIVPEAARRAAALAALGAARIGAGCADSAFALEPIYVRAPQTRAPQALTM